MKKKDIVNAWRNEEFARELRADQRAALPQNPAGPATLREQDLRSITGGYVACPTSASISSC